METSTGAFDARSPTLVPLLTNAQLQDRFARKRYGADVQDGAICQRRKVEALTDTIQTMSLSDSKATLHKPVLSTNRFDAFFAESDEDVNRLVHYYLTTEPNTPVALVSRSGDFDQEGLTVTPMVVKDGNGRVQESQSPGLLNGTRPATLIFDCRKMTPGNIAARNELMDKPPKFRGQPLNPACRVVVLIDKAMVPVAGQANRNKCGDDFWRRISRCHNTWIIPDEGSNTLACDRLPVLRIEEEAGPNDVVLDCSTTTDWYQLVFGRVVLDYDGNRHYCHGPLYEALGQGTCGRVILRGAPWHDPRFRLAIEQLMVQRSYEVNGEVVNLGNVAFVCQEADPRVISALKTRIRLTEKCDGSYFSLNQNNFDDCLGESVIDKGGVAREDVLGGILNMFGGLRVTSRLSSAQWHRLLLRIQQWGEMVDVAVDDPTEQPLDYAAGMRPAVPAHVRSSLTVVYCEDEAIVTGYLTAMNTEGKPAVYELSVTPDMELAQLTGEISISSLKRRRVAFNASGLIQALDRGEPIVLRNIHKNPVLQRQLEGLCLEPPRLLINGKIKRFINASVVAILPPEAGLSSPVWQKAPGIHFEDDGASCLKKISNVYKLNEEDQGHLTQARTFLAKVLTAVPSSSRKLWPSPPQGAVFPVLMKIARQVQALRQKSLSPAGCDRDPHSVWREAIRQVVLQEYQGLPEMSAWLDLRLLRFFPLQGEQANDWIDPAPFLELLDTVEVIDQTTLGSYCWRLSRGLSPACFPESIERYESFSQGNRAVLIRALLSCCPEERKESLRATLSCFPSPLELPHTDSPLLENTTEDWQSWQEERLETLETLVRHHPLVFLKGEPGAGKTWSASEVARRLNPEQPPIVVTASPMSDQSQLMRVPVRDDFLSLTEGELNSLSLSQEERLVFETLVQKWGVVKGDLCCLPLTGDVQAILNNKFRQDSQDQLKMYRDARTRYEDGPLLRWAKTASEGGKPVVLIIDEANLAPAELWDMFQGLEGDHPTLSFGGEVITLGPYHRVVFTGNPETAAGRNTSLGLRQQAVTQYFPALPEAFLQERVLRPRLQNMGLAGNSETVISTRIAALWQRFRALAPEYEFTPRDIHEICDRLQLYLSIENAGDVSDPVLLRLVWLAVSETLGGSCSSETEALESLELWYRHCFGTGDDVSLTEIDRRFYSMLVQLQTDNSGFYCQGTSVEQLARVYWSALYKRQQMAVSDQVFQGKRATLVEGPAGRGKDALLHQILQQTNTQYVHLNAGCSDWQTIRDVLRHAAANGQVVAISELNLLPSAYLEGELNDILTGAASPGFHLFATVNPPEFSGRERLSPALQSRFVSSTIGDYSNNELEAIALSRSHLDRETVSQLVNWHCQLRRVIQKMGGATLQPGTSTLLALIEHLHSFNPVTVHNMQESFLSLYQIPLLYADMTLDTLGTLGETTKIQTETNLYTGSLCRELMQWVYTHFPNIGPVTLRRGFNYEFCPETGHLRVPESVLSTTDEVPSPEVVGKVARSVVEGLWCANGMPAVYPDSGDILACHLFTHWQRMFAGHLLGTLENKQQWLEQWYPYPESGGPSTMELKENQKLIKEAEAFLSKAGTNANPVLYRRFLMILAPWRRSMEEYLEEMSTGQGIQKNQESMETDAQANQESMEADAQANQESMEADAQANQESMETDAQAAESRIGLKGGSISAFTPYRSQAKDSTGRKRIVLPSFRNTDFTNERMNVFTPMYSSEQGMLVAQDILGESGFNRVPCEAKPAEYVLENSEIPGQMRKHFTNKSWTSLVGLKYYPRARLKYIAITPHQPFEVVQERASGMYLVRLLEKPINTSETDDPFFTVDCVLEMNHGISPPGRGVVSGNAYCECPADVDSAIREHTDPIVVQLRESLKMASTLEDRIKLIRGFCSSGRVFKSYETLKTTGREQLTELLAVRPSDYLSRAIAFWMLSSWCHIPVRFSISGGRRAVVELSQDSGYTQSVYDLYGHLEDVAPYEVVVRDFSAVAHKSEKEIDRRMFRECNPDKAAEMMDTIRPGNPNYSQLCLFFGHFFGSTISLSGPVSVEKVKAWLQTFSAQADYRLLKSRPQMLCDMMANIGRRMEEQPSEELKAVYQELSRFILDQAWLTEGSSCSMIHFLQFYKERQKQRAALYSDVFTHDLEAANDIRRPGEPLASEVEELYLKRFSADVIHEVMDERDKEKASKQNAVMAGWFADFFQHMHSPKLMQTLLGEVPGVQYRDAPPGTLDLERLVRQLPVYRCNATVVSVRPALVISPADKLNTLICKKITPLIEKPKKTEVDSCTQASMAETLAEFISMYVRSTFMGYLYHKGGGDRGSLKVLFPADLKRSHSTPLVDPYRPLRAGWVAPKNPQDFEGLMSVPSTEFVDHKQSDLQQAWASKGFNQTDLCLLDQNLLLWTLEDYLKDVDWRSLVKGVLAHPAWKEYAEEVNKKIKEDYLEMRIDGEGFMQNTEGGTLPDDFLEELKSSQEFKEAGLVDDINDALKDEAM